MYVITLPPVYKILTVSLGVVAVELDWLPMYASAHCRFSEPKEDADPRFDIETGNVVHRRKVTFGKIYKLDFKLWERVGTTHLFLALSFIKKRVCINSRHKLHQITKHTYF